MLHFGARSINIMQVFSLDSNLNSPGAAMLVCSLLLKSRKGWFVAYLILLLIITALFMTSVKQTAGHRTIALTVVFSRP